ncbi:MAG: glycosyltransferase [Thermoleophilia bacterium]|nr:glycosyltransferase [Thermoleophilia bacterium]
MSIVWRSRLLDASDHAAGTRAVVRALDAAGAQLSLQQTPWDAPSVVSEAELAWFARRDRPPARTGTTVQRTLARLLTPYVHGIGAAWTAFAGEVPDRETLLRLRQMDVVWVPSAAQRDALLAAGLEADRVLEVPEPVDLAVFRPDAPPFPAPGAHGTVFVAMCGPGPADGADLLARAWARAFRPGDDVTLVLVPAVGERTSGPEPLADAMVAAIRADGHDPSAMADMVILDEPLAEHRVAGLLAGAAAVVVPARAAGLGRRIAEAAATGRPVIGARAHGVTDATGWTVEARIVPVGDVPGHRELAESRWHEQDPDALAAALAEAHASPAGRAARGAAGRESATRHDHHAVAAAALAHLAAAVPARPAGRLRLGLTRAVLEGPVLGPSPLAGLNRDLARALAHGWEVALSVVEAEAVAADVLPPDDDALVRAMALRHAGAPHVVVRDQHPPQFAAPAHGALVHFLHWEFGALPEQWRAGAAALDEIWVASPHVRDALLADGVHPDRVTEIPMGVDTARFHPGTPEMDLADAAPGLRFLFVGGLVWRKGADLLLEAYARAFTRDDDVTLVVKDFGAGGPYPPSPEAERAARMAADPRGPRVLRLTGMLPAADIPGLYRACDALVHPDRAEAFGLTMLEAMACGLTVIAPDHGPAGGFLLPDAAIPLPAHPVRATSNRFGPWTMAEPPLVGEVAVDDLAAAMRRVYEDPAGVAARAARAVEVASARTWTRAAGIAADRLRILAATPRRAAA